jgi:predicted DNA-binding antitoxin AbrB/MazE fold protein
VLAKTAQKLLLDWVWELMQKTFEAVYEDGVLRPTQPLSLPDRARVIVTIADAAAIGSDPSVYFSPEEWERAKNDTITLEEVRRALSSMEGSLSDAVIASREER